MGNRVAQAAPDRTPAVDPRWRAVLTRDARYDGIFLYAVRSTGVYCRPSCPSRRPGRAQVEFFALADAAERAGFRPCLRCRPRAVRADDPAVALTRRACQALEESMADDEGAPDLEALGRRLGVSPHRLRHAFHRVLGITPREYADARRWSAFKSELRRGHSVTRSLYGAGYGSSSRVYEHAAAQLGMTPATYKRGGRGMRIEYRIVGSPLGRLLVAATERGVCSVRLGEGDAALVSGLTDEYPAAEIRRGGARLAAWMGRLVDHLRGRAPHPELPLDVRATAFQRRVWRELSAIPAGRTRTYGEIARAIGKPRAARAVGRACATNPVALLIPCHRAVGADGALTGYRWGVTRKRRLLEREAAAGGKR